MHYRVNDLTQIGPYGKTKPKDDTKIHGAIIIIMFFFFAASILGIWINFLPQMEEAGRETESLVSGTAAESIVNTDIIPEIQLFFILTITGFALLDGFFSYMLFTGEPREEHKMLINPFFIMYLISRFTSGFIISVLTSIAVISDDPRLFMNLLYISVLIISSLNILIILIFYMKVFTSKKTEAIKVLERGSQSAP